MKNVTVKACGFPHTPLHLIPLHTFKNDKFQQKQKLAVKDVFSYFPGFVEEKNLEGALLTYSHERRRNCFHSQLIRVFAHPLEIVWRNLIREGLPKGKELINY